MCAVQGGSFPYSFMVGQSVLPWRPLPQIATSTTGENGAEDEERRGSRMVRGMGLRMRMDWLIV